MSERGYSLPVDRLGLALVSSLVSVPALAFFAFASATAEPSVEAESRQATRSPDGREASRESASEGSSADSAPHARGLRLAGIVVDDRGEPMAGKALLVVPADLDPAREVSYPEAQTFTDEHGAFEFGGLLPQPYRIRVRRYSSDDYPLLLTPEPVQPGIATDDPGLHLVLTRPLLAVRLLDVDGRPWSGPALTLREYDYPPDTWPEAPSLLVTGCFADRDPRQEGVVTEGECIAADLAEFEVSPSTHGFVTVLGAGFDGRPQPVEIPAGAGRVTVEVRASARFAPGEVFDTGFGTLSVRVGSAAGELGVHVAGVPFDHGVPFALEVESPSSGHRLLAADTIRNGPPYAFRVPPGTYRVVARGYPRIEPYHAGLERPRELGRDESEVTLAAGARQEIRLELDTGARLELTLEGEGRPGESQLARRNGIRGKDERLIVAEVTLVDARGRSEPVYRRVKGFYQDNLVSTWPLGDTSLSERLPTGRATVVARLISGREARAEVELFECETAKVTLRF